MILSRVAESSRLLVGVDPATTRTGRERKAASAQGGAARCWLHPTGLTGCHGPGGHGLRGERRGGGDGGLQPAGGQPGAAHGAGQSVALTVWPVLAAPGVPRRPREAPTTDQ